MELVEGGELFDHIVQMGAFTEPVARYVRGHGGDWQWVDQDDKVEQVQARKEIWNGRLRFLHVGNHACKEIVYTVNKMRHAYCVQIVFVYV